MARTIFGNTATNQPSIMKKKWFLFPFALLYNVLVFIRNYFFSVNIFKKYRPPMFTVSVGNIQVGGTGKTPHVEYLIDLFASKQIAVLSRGYGRTTTGFLIADEISSTESIGDEPFQIYSKFKEKVRVYVSENRPRGVLEILKLQTPEVLLLDDAFQHQYIERDINFLLTTFDDLFVDDFLLPVGQLREPRSGVNRADAIIVTKSPIETSRVNKDFIINKLQPYLVTDIPIFFSKFLYGKPIGFRAQKFCQNAKVVLLSGIGKPNVFEKFCGDNFHVEQVIRFSDHFKYTRLEVDKILGNHDKVQFLTTEKDFVKLVQLLKENEQGRFFYLPIKVNFEESAGFDSFVLKRFKKFQSR